MNWYYLNEGQQHGPVPDAEFERLKAMGTITPTTLVWNETLADWVNAGQVRRQVPLDAPAPTSSHDRQSARPAGGLSDRTYQPVSPGAAWDPEMPAHLTGQCIECGLHYQRNDLIPFSSYLVCGNCKPVFFQKVREGLRVGNQLNYADFLPRFAAWFLDTIILGVVSLPVSLVAGYVSGVMGVDIEQNPASLAPFFVIQIVSGLLNMTIQASYSTFLIGKYGSTLGMKALKLKVVMADGGKVSYLRAFGRYWANLLTSMTCLIGYLMAIPDEEKRTLHDHICSTRVVQD